MYKPEDKDTRERNARLQARKEDFRKGTAQQNLEGLIKTRKPLYVMFCFLPYDIHTYGIGQHLGEPLLHRPCPWRPQAAP